MWKERGRCSVTSSLKAAPPLSKKAPTEVCIVGLHEVRTLLGGYFPKAPQIQAHTRMSMGHCVNKLVRTITHTALFAYSLGEKEGGGGWYSVCQAPLVCKEHNKDWKPCKHLVRRKECNFVFLGQKLFCKFKAALYLTSFLTLCEN